jgi:hypothetical protein
MGESMKRSIAALIALFLLAFAVNGFAMGGGEQQQQQEQQPGVQERAGEQPADQQWGEQQQMQQTFTGTVDRAGDNWVLIMDGTAYELDVEDEEQVRGMMGQEVEIRGTLDGQTIQADTIQPSGQGQQPMSGQDYQQQQPGGQPQ